MLNKFLLTMVAILVVGWWAEEHVDFDKIKQDAMDAASKEKTINTINSSRELRQEEYKEIMSGKKDVKVHRRK